MPPKVQTVDLVRREPTEAEFTRQVIQYAQLHGWRTAHFRAAMAQSGRWMTAVQGDGKGFPDLVLVGRGRCIVAELKVGKNKPAPEQVTWLESFLAAGIPAFIWRPTDWDAIEAALRAEPGVELRIETGV